MRNKRNEYFGPMDKARIVLNEDQNTLTFRSEQTLRIYACRNKDFGEEVLIGLGIGEQVVDAPPRHWLRFESEGRIWMMQTRREQSVEGTEETYATLDRPNPLSPEMRMIQMMMMKNQREREQDRAEIEALRAQRLEFNRDRASAPEQELSGAAPAKVRGKQKPSAASAEKSHGTADRTMADPARADDDDADTDGDIETGDV